MLQHIADFSLEKNEDLAAAHVAIFALSACLSGWSARPTDPTSFRLLPNRTIVNQLDLATLLAKLSKPVWLDGRLADGQFDVEVGPLVSRPLLLQVHRAGQGFRTGPQAAVYRAPPDAVVLCHTDKRGLRVRRAAFNRYEQDYELESPCTYGSGLVLGISADRIGLTSAELAGVSEVIRITPSGRGTVSIEESP